MEEAAICHEAAFFTRLYTRVGRWGFLAVLAPLPFVFLTWSIHLPIWMPKVTAMVSAKASTLKPKDTSSSRGNQCIDEPRGSCARYTRGAVAVTHSGEADSSEAGTRSVRAWT